MEELTMLLRTVAQMAGINQIQDGLNRLQGNAQNVSRTLGTIGGAGLAIGGATVAGATMAVRAFATLEEQQYSYQKNLELSAQEQVALNREMERADMQSGITSSAFYETAASYASAGIGADQLADLTLTTGQAMKALDLSSQSAVIAVNEARDGFGLAGSELKDYLQATNLLANSSTANAQNLVDVSSRTAALAATVGLAANQNLVLNTAFAEAAPSAEVAASAQVRMMSVLGNMTNASGDAQSAIQELGFGVNEYAQMFAQDGVKATQAFSAALMDKAPSDRLRIMSDLFGNEMTYNSAILKVASNQANLAKYSQLANDEAAKQSAWMAETGGASELLSANLMNLQKTFTYTMADIGAAIAPALAPVIAGLTSTIQKIGEFAESNPRIVQVLAMLGLAIGVAGAALVGLGVVLGPIMTSWGLIAPLFTIASAAIAGISLPVVAAIAAIVGLGLAAYQLITNWSSVTAFFQNLWATLTASVSSAIAQIRGNLVGFSSYLPGWAGIVGNAVNAARALWPTLSAAVQSAVSAAQGALSGFIGFISGLAGQAGAAAAQIGQSIIDGLMSTLGGIQAAASSVAGAIAAVLPGSPVSTGPLTVLNQGYAGGQISTMLAEGISSRAGEVADALTSIFTPATASLAGGGDMNVAGGINFYGANSGDSYGNAERLMGEMGRLQQRKQRRKY